MSGHSFPEATYYDNYSEDEGNDEDKATDASSADEEDEDEDEDDFVPKSRGDSGPANKKRRLSQRDDPPISSSSTIPITAPASTPAASLPQPLPGRTLEPSIINAEPLDEFIREIADWILRIAGGKNYIEASLRVYLIVVLNQPIFAKVEAKIGILIDSRTGMRLNIPVLSETSLLKSSHMSTHKF